MVTDADVVARVVTALVDNAVKHTAPGPAVTVTIEGSAAGAQIRVSDACGVVPEADLRRLFQRTFRGDHASDERSGLGLGPYIAQRLSEYLGGRLDAHNADRGCVFTLHLPASPAAFD